MIWKIGRYTFDLREGEDAKGVLMGILNTTPDSFSDGGEHCAIDKAVTAAEQMINDGAKIIDIGGESTRPGAEAVSVEEEIARTVPLIEELRKRSDVLISIDTSKSQVAAAALAAGADIVNDVTGLTADHAMLDVCADSDCGVIVMHMQGNPRTMQKNPYYEKGVVEEVAQFFIERMNILSQGGVDSDRVCLDVGIGFGKSVEHNLDLLRHLSQFQIELQRPIMLGVSRKSILGAITGERLPQDRDAATAVITALALRQGILMHRVHNVSLHQQALKIVRALD